MSSAAAGQNSNASARRFLALGKLRGLRHVLIAAASGVLVASAVAVPSAKSGVLLVCADPDNLPFSNQEGDGFENKLAELIAAQFKLAIAYTWLPQMVGHAAAMPERQACDLLLGYAQGGEQVDDTNPYYRTSYVLLYREGDERLAGIESLSDKRLKTKTIGIIARTPPAAIMSANGLVANTKLYEGTPDDRSERAVEKIVAAIAAGEIDAGVVWGPVGGYYSMKSEVPLKLVPLVKETAGPQTVYGITMGVQRDEPEWKYRLNKFIADKQDDINALLAEYNVPLLDENGNPIRPSTAQR
jgi:quinoprotein dehydrogenase-associated probable ABC transporter substrate-binding protein